ncbi:hypothetical protein [Oceanicola sp. 502str15]|uniref:hypothetical protein n=1 Tax=Oceanicola sp. 502str15 TaxID=2696061 RepID=UPI002095C70D|nr:hypothetical protein [Oceanicola sp. 502str15]MCO6383541.1 hypothetical protein [Oceanicola sp. 502str15]
MKYALGIILAWAALPAQADTVGMCVLAGTAEEACTCAAEGLAGEVSAEDFAHYDAIAAEFVKRRKEGLSWVEAWDAGVAKVAEEAGMRPNALQQQMNPVGSAHREVMLGCM